MMDAEVDHYVIMGLPTGEQGVKLSKEEITKAFKSKVKELHPDKRPDDPNAHDNFVKFRKSYDILNNDKDRQKFNDRVLLKAKKKIKKSQQQNSKRRRKTDLEKREQAVRDDHSAEKKARDEEELIRKSNQRKIAELNRLATATRAPPAASTSTLNQGASTRAEEAPTHCRWSSDVEFKAFENSVLTKGGKV